MVLSTHAVIGAATAVFLKQNPVLAFFAGFVSHFIFDAIPHWHYPMPSLRHNPANPMKNFFVYDSLFMKDVAKTAVDFGIGLAVTIIALLQSPEHIFIALIGAVGAVLPDALQLVYYLFPKSPLQYFQKFHVTVAHAKTRLDNQPIIGIGSQAALIALCAAILFFRS